MPKDPLPTTPLSKTCSWLRCTILDSNGDFLDRVKNTAGVWVKQDEISHIMFYTRIQSEVTQNGQDDINSTKTAP